jgi:hypothetical protein
MIASRYLWDTGFGLYGVSDLGTNGISGSTLTLWANDSPWRSVKRLLIISGRAVKRELRRFTTVDIRSEVTELDC